MRLIPDTLTAALKVGLAGWPAKLVTGVGARWLVGWWMDGCVIPSFIYGRYQR
ncbi:hypothetical protein DL89DRAFT_265196, partial [Linderina pennispora]